MVLNVSYSSRRSACGQHRSACNRHRWVKHSMAAAMSRPSELNPCEPNADAIVQERHDQRSELPELNLEPVLKRLVLTQLVQALSDWI